MTPLNIDELRHYLVFRIGSSLLGWPADRIREVTACPQIVRVPQSPPILRGLAHIRNQFLPVIDASDLLGDSSTTRRFSTLLIVSESAGDLGIGIDEGLGVEPLETSFRREFELSDGTPDPLIGTAGFRDSVVRVLEPDVVVALVKHQLKEVWNQHHSTHGNPNIQTVAAVGAAAL